MSAGVEQSTSASWQPAIVRIQNKFQTNVIGHIWDDFYRSYDQTNSVKALKETS